MARPARARQEKLLRLALIVLVLVATLWPPPVGAQEDDEATSIVYTIIDLGPLVHSDETECPFDAPGASIRDVAAGSRAVGSVYHEGERAVAALFAANRVRKMSSGPGGGVAYAVNRGGEIAGAIFSEPPVEPCGLASGAIPARWNRDFELERLDLPEWASEGAATAINDLGAAAGWVETEGGRRAAIWHVDGVTVIDHAGIDGVPGFASEAVAINDNGVVAGTIRWLEGERERSRPFTWDGANVHYLDPWLGRDGYATAINQEGVVSGAVIDSRGILEATLWWRGQIVSLGRLPDRPHAVATDINSGGFAVGYGAREDGLTRAVIWIGGTAIDLNAIVPLDSGWQLQMAVGINDDGLIAGYGDLDGARHAFLLVPAAG